jgi:arabinose-5-phosphate isomerase
MKKLASDILAKEIEGVLALKSVINENLEQVIKVIANCKGRVVLSGVGKSGYIGKKISSTMSSIGIPSFFLNPTEASHGDLGMLKKEDVIILISNSGETKEFNSLISFIQKEKLVSIALTRSEFSTLSNSTNYKINIPPIPEVLSYGAPTTSTTQMLVVGDIISVCASNLKGFNENDYAKIHPGGKLGLSLTKISEIMRKIEDTEITFPNILMKAVLPLMKSGFIAVSDKKNELVGIVTDGDIRRAILKYGDILEKSVSNIMSKAPVTLSETENLVKAVELFNEKKIGTLIITDKSKKIKGSLDRKDIAF